MARLGWASACLAIALTSSLAHASYPVITQAQLSGVVEADSSFGEFQAQSNRSQVAVTDEAVLHAGWNLISIPYQPADPSPEAVFEGIPIADNLYRYDPMQLAYVAYDGFDPSAFGPCKSGDAYQLYALGGERLTVPEGVAFTHWSIDLPVSLPLVSRPILIGSPGLSPLSLLDCRVWVEDGEQWQPWLFADLLARGEFASSLLWLDPTNQNQIESDPRTERLYPWRGYWLPRTPLSRCMLDLQ